MIENVHHNTSVQIDCNRINCILPAKGLSAFQHYELISLDGLFFLIFSY